MTLYEETEGAYDVTSAPLWEAWGFARRAGEIPFGAIGRGRTRVGGHLVELDAVRRTVRFRRPGVRINLGSIGKGYVLDLCGQRLAALGMADFLLHGGQSSVLARGSRTPGLPGRRNVCLPGCEALGGWHSPPAAARSAAGSSFGSTTGRWEPRAGQFQSFRHRGRRYGHILDPRSGRPAEGVLSSTVVAPTAALADALSTAF